jgi:predicted phage terminase large subunit-like protein
VATAATVAPDAEKEAAQQLHADLFIRLVARARKDFLSYLLLFNPPERAEYVVGQLHVFLSDMLQAVAVGKACKRQIINVPPQHGKSTLVSKEFVSWIISYQPGIQVALTSFSHELVTDFSKWVRSRVQSPLYQKVFPNSQVDEGNNKAALWHLTNGSSVCAKSTGKKLIGRRVDLLIIDDAHSGRQDAESVLMRKRIREWYFGDCLTRMSPEGYVFIIGTRWHPEDLSGHLTSEEYEEGMRASGLVREMFNKINLPAFSEGDGDPLGRSRDEPLFPEMRGKEFLENMRAAQAPYEWESQFQGHPQTSGSGQVDTKKIHRITLADVPKDLERTRGWDLALKEKQTSDFTAGALCAYDRAADHFYIMDMVHEKMVWARAKPAIIKMSMIDKEEHGVVRIGMEAVSGFSIGRDEMAQSLLGELRVEERNPKTDKLLRAQPWLNKIEAGKVSMVVGEWNRRFLRELAVFPDGDHDDQVDAVSVAWEMLFTKRTFQFA